LFFVPNFFSVANNILVTGGAGFIGSNLAESLLRDSDWQVTIVDDLNDFYSPAIKHANLEAVRKIGDFQFFEKDIRDFDGLRNVFDETEFDCIVHLAARAGVRPSLAKPRLYAETPPKGFAFSDTAFRVFILMASRRLKSDRFYTYDFRPEVYSPEGMAWIADNTLSTVLARNYPELAPRLNGVTNRPRGKRKGRPARAGPSQDDRGTQPGVTDGIR
jgi:nucleoside-diphosphate-sugar epimerase